MGIRIGLLPGALLTATIASCGSPAIARMQRHYDLASQDLGTALAQFSSVSGREIVASSDLVAQKRSAAVRGDFSPQEALDLLLGGTGLRSEVVGGAFVIRPAPAADHAQTDLQASDIVVTGTRIRGARVASPVITISGEDARNSGQATLGEIVRSVPQSFGGGQQPGIGFNVPEGSGSDVGGGSSINLRGIGSDATLTLLNGHRVSYSGSRQSIDVSAIPLSAVDRIEIVPDGASAIYGSDAVAGVANIILKRDYDGIETRARLGASTDGGNFTQQFGALGGTTWQAGGFALAYEFNRNTQITSSQRSYARDISPGLTLLPAISSHNVLFTGHQALGADLTLKVDALYNQRSEHLVYPLDFGGDLAAMHGERNNGSKSFAVSSALDWRASTTWRMTLAATIADDRTRFDSREYVGTDQYFQSVGCYCNQERSVEASATGALATLPAGNLETAVGGGFRTNRTDFSAGTGNAQNFARRQDSYYAYAELALPIVSRAMAVRGIDRLDLNAAVRYENYPGIGDVATPKFGLIVAPDETIELKASWGTSFRAPTLRQQFQPTGVVLFPTAVAGGTDYPAGSVVAIVDGGNSALRPERASNWSATLVVHPPAWPGARAEVSYFSTDYRDRIVSPIDQESQALSNPIYQEYITRNPTTARVIALVAAAPTFINASGAPFDPAKIVAIADDSNVNAGRQRFHGFDVLASYRRDLGGSAGSIDLNLDASFLTSDQQITAALPVTKLAGTVFNPPRLRGRVSAGWTHAAITLNADLSYIGGVTDDRTTPTKRLAGMTPLDLTARLRPAGSGLLGGLDVIVTVQNVLNDKPAPLDGIFFEAPYDSTNYSPIGRFVSLSVAKRW